MVTLAHSRAEWASIAEALVASGTAAPRGLADRVRALVAEAAADRPDRRYALHLDEQGATAVRAAHRAVATPAGGEMQAAVLVEEAEAIVREHQRRPG